MTDEQINIKIDRIVNPTLRHVLKKRGLFYRPDAAGYTSRVEEAWRVDEATALQHVYPHDEPVTMHEAPPPNYAADLNACHEFEKTLTHINDWMLYDKALAETTEGFNFHATARQRCEAFLRVHNQWEEEA